MSQFQSQYKKRFYLKKRNNKIETIAHKNINIYSKIHAYKIDIIDSDMLNLVCKLASKRVKMVFLAKSA